MGAQAGTGATGDGTGSKPKRVAVDVGGTFTDVCVFDQETGVVTVAKTPSTPDPIDGVLRGIESAEVGLGQIEVFSHGTTVATNALITRDLPSAAMVTTKGFRDVIEIRRGWKNELWDAYDDVAPPYIRRRDRFEVSERVDYSGRALEPLDEAEARSLARKLKRREASSVAVCFVNSYANPEHERRMRDILTAELPDARISLSSDILPEIFEHERFSTTVANAVLAPIVGNYVRQLEGRLVAGGYDGDLLILHSGGGVMTSKTVERLAVRLASSGIAAGAIASRHLANLAGFRHSIGLDMGGTSTDISLVYDGVSRVTKEWYVEWGYPICFPSIEVLTIGAGGGSLAWIDEAGSLRNGPQSAGANPGPACYERGGDAPTNTDANLVLGRLGDVLIGGAMTLSPEAAARAIEQHVAEPLGLGLVEAASAIISVANANMADATRLVSIRRGYDPREFALVVFGGAGPLHGVDLARDLAIPVVLVPSSPGITSALGCLLVDIQHDLSTMFLARADNADPDEIEGVLRDLEEEAVERLHAEGVDRSDMVLTRYLDMRYVGQWRSMSLEVPRPVTSLEGAVDAFHREHQREHNYSRATTPVEIYRVNVRAVGLVPKPRFVQHRASASSQATPRDHRDVWFAAESEVVKTPVFAREALAAGFRLRGPAIIEQVDSTVLVPPETVAEVDEWLNLRLTFEGR
jgi:N-methylhydantoinase A